MKPCEWPVVYSSCDDCSLPEDATPEQIADQEQYESMAVEFLWNWTSRNLGLCPETVAASNRFDPCDCRTTRSTFWGRGPFNSQHRPAPSGPVLFDGEWYNSACGVHRDPAEVSLPGPVHDITRVEIDGVPFTGPIRVENRRFLIREDGEPWPDGIVVSYRRGIEVPIGGQIAAGRLACEFKKAACGDRTCSLPQRIQTISRQGVTVGIAIDQFEDIVRGGTGIWAIDSWVNSVTKPDRPSLVYSPDVRAKPQRRVVTWRPSAPSP